MKKLTLMIASLAILTMTSCGGLMTGAGSGSTDNTASVLGGVLGAMTNGETIGNVLSSVLGANKPAVNEIYGTWNYRSPGVAFTSNNLLAKAGGEVAATTVKQKLTQSYNQFGITNSNTRLQFNQDNTFAGILRGQNLSGTWTYDASNQKITLRTLLFSVPVYVQRTSAGMSFLLESQKLLTILQTGAVMSGNSSLGTIADLSKNYDGIRLGFEMNR